jgi:hypothetical protein
MAGDSHLRRRAGRPDWNETRSIELSHMVRMGSRKWTDPQTAHLAALIDEGASTAAIAETLH